MDKKIEPTDAMVTVAAHALCIDATGMSLYFTHDPAKHPYGNRARIALRAALNHPDAAGLFAGEDARPWEPLNGPVRVGDEVRRDHRGMTTTAVVGRVDGLGDPWTAEGGLIRVPSSGTWYVRRHVQELPTESGAVIVPAEGCAHIEASAIGGVWRAKEAALGADGMWHGVWRRVSGGVGMPVGPFALPEIITPGTWQVDDQ